MAINKVVYGNQTLIDLTTDTVASADDILLGKVGHLRDGSVVTGTASGGDQHGTIWQDGQGNVHLDDESGIALQSKTVTPTESQQVVEAGEGYYALDKVTVSAISSSYVGSGITRRSSSDLTASGATVTVPSGYYSAQASKAVASGTAGTPTAIKGTVSNHSVSVTPSVTNTTGYITGGTKNGTAVSVSASELVSGTLSVTSSGTKDVTNYASASVPAGTEGTPTATKGTVSNHAISVTPKVTNTGGYIAGSTKTGTAVTVSASELVSGTRSITENGTGIDVTNYASVDVSVASKLDVTFTSSGSGANLMLTPNVTYAQAKAILNSGGALSLHMQDYYDNQFGYSSSSNSIEVIFYDVDLSGTLIHYYLWTTSGMSIDLVTELIDKPSRTLEIEENGTYDVTHYASVNVDASTDFLVTLTKNQNDEWMPDCTFAEAYSAYLDGKTIVARTGGYEGVFIVYDDDADVFIYTVAESFDEFNGTRLYNWGTYYQEYVWTSEGVELDADGKYYDTSLANAVPSDVANGKIFHNTQGVQVGTASGGSTQYAATIHVIGNAYSGNRVTYNDTSYYTNGAVFTFTSGNTLTLRSNNASGDGDGKIYIDDVLVATGGTAAITYSYTLPSKNIVIFLSANSNTAYVKLYTELHLGTLDVTQNGTYTALNDGYEGYSSVTVNVSSGDGGGTAGICTGTFTVASDITTSAYTTITTVANIGFTPTTFILNRDSVSTTDKCIHHELFTEIGGTNYLRTRAIYSGQNGTFTATSAYTSWSASTSGYLRLSGGNIQISTTSSYILKAGTYTWIAIQ